MISSTLEQLLAIGAGVVAVPLASLLKNPAWASKAKFLSSAVVSALASLGVSIPIDATNAATVHYGATAATSVAVSQVVFKLLFDGTKAEDKLANSLVKPRELRSGD